MFTVYISREFFEIFFVSQQDAASFTEVWFRPLSECGSVAVVLLSLRADLPVKVLASFSDVSIQLEVLFINHCLIRGLDLKF